MTEKQPDVNAAYALQSPQDSQRLYADWAATYDDSFAERTGFLMPAQVAEIFHANGGQGPVLDAGAGTGLVGQEITKYGKVDIDAFDITQEMLNEARQKNVYRNLYQGDLTLPLEFQDGIYNAVVSSGTFTHGHVGPDALDELVRIAAPGALFVLTIKRDHFEERGFAEKFEKLSGMISGFHTVLKPIYGGEAPADKGEDQGLIVVFRRS